MVVRLAFGKRPNDKLRHNYLNHRLSCKNSIYCLKWRNSLKYYVIHESSSIMNKMYIDCGEINIYVVMVSVGQ